MELTWGQAHRELAWSVFSGRPDIRMSVRHPRDCNQRPPSTGRQHRCPPVPANRCGCGGDQTDPGSTNTASIKPGRPVPR